MAKAQALSVHVLSEGWYFKQGDDSAKDAWMPVKKVPTNVHLDLMENEKYVQHPKTYMNLEELTRRLEFQIPSWASMNLKQNG